MSKWGKDIETAPPGKQFLCEFLMRTRSRDAENA